MTVKHAVRFISVFLIFAMVFTASCNRDTNTVTESIESISRKTSETEREISSPEEGLSEEKSSGEDQSSKDFNGETPELSSPGVPGDSPSGSLPSGTPGMPGATPTPPAATPGLPGGSSPTPATPSVTPTQPPSATPTPVPDISTPAIISTRFPTEDVVVADFVVTNSAYGADPTGVRDSTNAIQRALNDCLGKGGGTVWIPEGTYRITRAINIPQFVTLRGDWRDPEKGTGSYGTVIHADLTPGDNSNHAFIVYGSAGIMGVTIFYPNQNAQNPVPYNWTISTVAGHMMPSIMNVTLLNSYRGIGNIEHHEMMTVRNLRATVLYEGGASFTSTDVSVWEDVILSNKYWAQAPSQYNPPSRSQLDNWTRNNATGLIFGDSEWEHVYRLSLSDFKTGIHIVPRRGERNIEFSGIFAETRIINCGTGVKIDMMDPRWGMAFIRSTIQGSVKAIENNTQGYVKLTDTQVQGEMSGIIINNPPGNSPSEDIRFNGTNKPSRLVLYDVTKSPYNAPFVPSRGTQGLPAQDATQAIQRALNDAGSRGGGIVYIPAGWYRINTRLTVPANVELRGSSSSPHRDQAFTSAGTVLLAYEGKGTATPDTDPAFITLSGDNAGIRGLRIFYPENNPKTGVHPFPYTIRGNGKNLYVINTASPNSYNSIDFRTHRCDNYLIRRYTGSSFRNTIAVGESSGGWIENVLTNPNAPARVAFGISGWIVEQENFDYVVNPVTRENQVTIEMDGASNQRILNTFSYGAKNFMVFNNCNNVIAINVSADNLKRERNWLGRRTGAPMLITNGGSVTIMNMLRYNGTSFENSGTNLVILNRMVLYEDDEPNIQ